ncbi:DUF2125 domain-containing protein [Celeribacter sp.]|uniref:DUF2125 domain-containing protein n=1 Tax=Celeribacter sp. TaxID=1890673 RepID=UPI003A914D2D
MRKVLWLLLIAAALYSGYWFVAATGSERAIAAWLDGREAAGWQAEYEGVETGGYPLRFERVIIAPQLADPRTGVAYRAPFVEISSASYAPTALTTTFASEATLSTPLQKIEITQDEATADLFVEADSALTLERAAVTLRDLSLTSSLDWGLSVADLHGALVRRADGENLYDINAHFTDLAPSDGLIAALDADGLLSDRFEQLEFVARVAFDTPWDITALEHRRPQPTRIELENLAARWGKLDLQIAGNLDIDARGVATGRVAVKARNWREMVEIAVATGALPADLESLTLRAGQMLAGLKGNADTIDAELTLSDGMISLGFIPIGPAPRFIIR